MRSVFSIICMLGAALTCGIVRAGETSDRISVTVKGRGPDIVLIPGMTCSASVWDGLVSHLQDHYRLHLIQVAGFAGAPAGANREGPVLQPTVDAIDDYIKRNKLPAPRIIGHSVGGLMGLMLADQHPEDVGSVMVVDSLPFFSVLFGAKDVASVKPQAAAIRDRMINEIQDAYAWEEKIFLPRLVKSPDGLKLATQWALASDKSVVARAMYDDMTTDLRPKLASIKTPVTVLYPWDASGGETQAAVDGRYHQNFASLPNKKLIRIDGSYHFIMFDQPTAFAHEVDVFLQTR